MTYIYAVRKAGAKVIQIARVLVLIIAVQIVIGSLDFYGDAYTATGLPKAMIEGRRVGEALLIAGWSGAFLLSLNKQNQALAGNIALILSGMFAFDLGTTYVLQMPSTASGPLVGGISLFAQLSAAGILISAGAPRAASNAGLNGIMLVGCVMWLAILSYLFLQSSLAVSSGAFNTSGIPFEVLHHHTALNAIESLIWLLATVTLILGKTNFTKPLCLFGAGLWGWDMTTTAGLEMPVWPYYTTWGTLIVVSMIATGVAVDRRAITSENFK